MAHTGPELRGMITSRMKDVEAIVKQAAAAKHASAVFCLTEALKMLEEAKARILAAEGEEEVPDG